MSFALKRNEMTWTGPPRKYPHKARVTFAEELGTLYKNNLRGITFGIRPIWIFRFLILIISWFRWTLIFSDACLISRATWILSWSPLYRDVLCSPVGSGDHCGGRSLWYTTLPGSKVQYLFTSGKKPKLFQLVYADPDLHVMGKKYCLEKNCTPWVFV